MDALCAKLQRVMEDYGPQRTLRPLLASSSRCDWDCSAGGKFNQTLRATEVIGLSGISLFGTSAAEEVQSGVALNLRATGSLLPVDLGASAAHHGSRDTLGCLPILCEALIEVSRAGTAAACTSVRTSQPSRLKLMLQ